MNFMFYLDNGVLIDTDDKEGSLRCFVRARLSGSF